MTHPVTLAIGRYNEMDAGPNQTELNALSLDSVRDLQSLPEDQRTAVRAIAVHAHDKFDGSVMDLLPNLELISNYGVGYDAIDVTAATERNIKVTNTPDVLNDEVADLAVAMLLVQAREILQASDWVRSGKWKSDGSYRLTRKVSGDSVGIVGLGRIGREIADRLAAFKMDIHYHSRTAKETPGWTYHADPVSLAGAVDCLIVALVGGSDTQGYVSADVLRALGPRGIVVNISRGSTIDEAALLDALEKREIAGACLDVFSSEPDIDSRFLALDNVLLQPHHGSATDTTRRAMGQLQRDNVSALLAGKPLLTPVN
ncbi:MAG: 2-hydroxyacid dehydrogenase [Gammaproteobacteria bacterium]|nr:2-hydroxyacid dehydrogenase [Gammaproteobacteria bacterium]